MLVAHFIKSSLFSASLALLCKPTTFLVAPKRSVRATRKIFRTKLPRYKLNLSNLPPLTKLLVQEAPANQLNDHLNSLRVEKLDTYKQYLPTNSKHVLLEALFSTNNDIDKLLRIIDENLMSMNSFYVGVSFEVLNDAIEFGLCDRSVVAVSPEFRNLCKRSLYKIRFFEHDELLKLLKCASAIGLPENSLLVQAAFQMTRHLINDFAIEELDSLANCLFKFELVDDSPKSLLVALRKAIPLAKHYLIEQGQYTPSDEPKKLESGAKDANQDVLKLSKSTQESD